MARRTKVGLDYFSLDVRMDTKIKLVEAKFGLPGFAILVKLYQHIYDQGYFCNWTEDDLLVFCLDNNIQEELMLTLIEFMLTKNIFDKNLYEKYSILTSSGIQKRYIQGTQRRKEIDFVKEYLLIEISPEMYPKYVNVNINSLNVDINSLNDNRSTQSKVKESKVIERDSARVRDNIFSSESQEIIFNNDIEKINNESIKFGMSGVTPEFLQDAEMRLSEGVDTELIIKALSVGATNASGNAGAKCRYAISVLQNWATEGITTMKQWTEKKEPKKAGENSGRSKTDTEPDYDYSKLMYQGTASGNDEDIDF